VTSVLGEARPPDGHRTESTGWRALVYENSWPDPAIASPVKVLGVLAFCPIANSRNEAEM